MSGGERFDVVGIGNALVDVLSNESHGFVTAQGLTPGAMTLIDTERAEQLYAAMGPAVEISGGSAANTLVGVTSLGGSAAFVGPRRRRPARCGLRARHPGRRRRVPSGGRRGRRAERPLPDRRHARRPAHHEHLPRRVGPARSGRRRPRPRGPGPGALPRGLPVGRTRRQGRVPARGAHRARCRQPGGVHAVRLVLRGTPPGGVPRPRGVRRRRAVRERGRDHLALRGRPLRRRAPAGAAPLRDRRAHAQREGRGRRHPRRGARGRRPSGFGRRRHDRRRGPVRGRVPLRAHPRVRPG